MTILFSLVARGSTVLAHYASCSGNFTQVSDQILAKLPSNDSKLTYSHDDYLFHYIQENSIVYLCITDKDFERSIAFQFLTDIKRRFLGLYRTVAQTAVPYSLNSEFSIILSSEMSRHSEGLSDNNKINKVSEDLDELKGIMVRNIESIATRGEKLDLLVDKTEDLEQTSLTFKKSSKKLSRAMCMKNAKCTIFLVVIVLLVIFFIFVGACGGFSFPCTKKKH
ncbi:Vesicle-associated membrane protein 7 [Trichoplax sp. H2]|uniref:Vesicle-associated membrane protein 7 n=1 Tax=Trichoplax adhaerens TaxID=10228 RepID=B3S793_TRIAD|nr:hypothetical protein TRIADDRAFT_30367 [Trichoplax adhaerens]EDV21529.1 hypothetical protein TRIADDRAFT_30367 [Trichoplax adhaerens]RDD37249.1 Vesicle-associated membrane protein 7 [Trichoplax sp. H2]|eukprot:XP_002116129.1 hypothetical protein TRIADDRAFT_30367 [Trichoplax adhaerens]